VLDHEQGEAARVQLADQPDQLRDRPLIDAAGHLVQQQDARLRGEGARQLEALALARGQRAGVRLRLVGESDPADQLACPLPRVPHVPRARERAHHHVVQHGHPREGAQLLERPRNPAAADRVRRQPRQRRTVEPHLPLVGMVEAGDDLEQGGLAGAVGADDPDQLAGRHVEGDPAVGRDAAEPLRHAGDGQEAHGAVLATRRRAMRSPIQPTSPWGAHRTIAMSAQP
jgi:hypothetical protein